MKTRWKWERRTGRMARKAELKMPTVRERALRALMAAAQLRDYLEWGNIHNSVNLPEVNLGIPEAARVLVIHENIPNMLATISACVSLEHINIDMMTNKSRKDMAVTVMDMGDLPSDKAIKAIAALPGVVRVRTFAR